MGSSVSEEFTVCVFRRLSEDGGSWFLQSSIHSRLFCVCLEGNSPSACWLKLRHEMERGQGLVLNNNSGRMITHINIYRKMSCFYHNFRSAYTAISDTTGDHFGASKLWKTCRLFTVKITTFYVGKWPEFSFSVQLCWIYICLVLRLCTIPGI